MRNDFSAIIRCGLLLVSLVFGSLAKADGSIGGLVFFPSLSVKQETGTLGGDQSALLTDLRFGYIIPSGFYFGFMYSHTSTIGSTGISQTSLGNSIGYFYNQLSIVGTYYLTSHSRETVTSNSVSRTEGSGYQFDFSYLFPVDAQIFIGPVLTYRALTFIKEENQDGTIASRGRSESFVYPFFGALYVF